MVSVCARAQTINQNLAAKSNTEDVKIRVESSVRLGWDNLFPLVEVFLTNESDKKVTWKRAWRDDNRILIGTNGVVWTQWYPTRVAAPGQTVEMQLVLDSLPKTNQTYEADLTTGQTVSIQVSPNAVAPARITGIAFSSNFSNAYITYNALSVTQDVSKVWINGKDYSQSLQLRQPPRGAQYGMLSARLAEPLKQGSPVHVRLEFPSGGVAQNLIRASWGISLDSWGVEADDVALRKNLGLDLKPFHRNVSEATDPTCSDAAAQQPGHTAVKMIAARSKHFKEGDPQLASFYYCGAGKGHYSYPIYGQSMDAAYSNPFQLSTSAKMKFIEEEEKLMEYAVRFTQPRVWGWIPEAFKQGDARFLEPQEFRMLTLAALGLGARGLMYYTYTPCAETDICYSNAPLLSREIRKVNREIKTMEPLLGSALVLSSEAVDIGGNSFRRSVLWSGESDSLVVIVRNLDYKTDRERDDNGNKPRFKVNPKKDVSVRVSKPDGFRAGSVTEVLTQEKIPFRDEEGSVILDLKEVELGHIIQIKNGPAGK